MLLRVLHVLSICQRGGGLHPGPAGGRRRAPAFQHESQGAHRVCKAAHPGQHQARLLAWGGPHGSAHPPAEGVGHQLRWVAACSSCCRVMPPGSHMRAEQALQAVEHCLQLLACLRELFPGSKPWLCTCTLHSAAQRCLCPCCRSARHRGQGISRPAPEPGAADSGEPPPSRMLCSVPSWAPHAGC